MAILILKKKLLEAEFGLKNNGKNIFQKIFVVYVSLFFARVMKRET